MTEKAKAPASELFDQALKNYEQALRAGIKVQEEASAYWTKLFNQAAARPNLQKQISSVANEVIPPTQKYMEGCLAIVEQNSRASVDLMKKGVEAVQATNLADSQSKLVDFCESSLKSLKSYSQSVVDLNTKAIDSWVGIVKKASSEVLAEKA
jgi:hypothetical protein